MYEPRRSRFVRPSKYRHVYGQPAKETFQNLRISANAWDSDMASVSAKYLAYSAQVRLLSLEG